MEKRKEQLSNNDDDDDDDDNEYYYYFPLFTFDELQTSTYQSSKSSFYENWIHIENDKEIIVSLLLAMPRKSGLRSQ